MQPPMYLLFNVTFITSDKSWDIPTWKKSMHTNLSNTETLGTKVFVLISKLQGGNNTYSYDVGMCSHVVIRKVSLKRGSTIGLFFKLMDYMHCDRFLRSLKGLGNTQKKKQQHGCMFRSPFCNSSNSPSTSEHPREYQGIRPNRCSVGAPRPAEINNIQGYTKTLTLISSLRTMRRSTCCVNKKLNWVLPAMNVYCTSTP